MVIRILFISAFCALLLNCASSEKKEKADLHLRIGLSHYESQNYPMALKEFLEAERLDPDNSLIQNNLGLAYFIRERYEEAEKHVRKALSLNKDYTEARNNLSRILIERGKYTEAEAELQLVLADLTYTGLEKAYVNLGLAQFHQKKFSNAQQSFLKAVQSNRESCIGTTYLGRSYFELKNYQRASEILDQAIGYCHKNFYDEPHYYSALSYYRMGQSAKSVARFEEIIKIYPNGEYREKSRAMLDLIKKGAE